MFGVIPSASVLASGGMSRLLVLLVSVIVLAAACGDGDGRAESVSTTSDPLTDQPSSTSIDTPGSNVVESTTITSTPAVEPGPVSDFEDIAGTYLRQTPGDPQFLHFFEDGSFHGSNNVDLVVDRPAWIFETRFEGTNVLVTSTDQRCGDDPDAIYEIQLLESGNLQLVAIEDPCPPRSGFFQGASLRITGQAAEWEPVP